jgi:glycosyltransferase involved in cell wall biosynthesis
MRIVLNALFLIPGRVGGSESYVRELTNALAGVDQVNDYILCLGPEAAPTFSPPGPRWSTLVSPGPSSARPLRLALEQTWLPRTAAALGADLIHSAGYTGPLVSRGARVTTIHDMNYKRHPEDLSLTERLVYSAIVPRVARRSHRVLTLSDAARADIVRWTRVRPGTVVVAHLGARQAWPGEPAQDADRLTAVGVSEPFVLSVAASYPHKNLARLIRAFPLDASSPTVRLVVVGLKGRGQAAIEAASRSAGWLEILGWVDDALLASLYRRSQALAFPSLYEGFGLPILESMALSTPVVTSNTGAMAEIANGAAELVDPYDVASIREGLRRVVFDPVRSSELRRLGVQRAARFTWKACAEATVAVYADALAAVS